MSHQFVGKNLHHFKYIKPFFSEKRMKKKTKKGESQKKKGETISQDTEKRQNTDKQM